MERSLEGQTGAGEGFRASNPTPKKYLKALAYWKVVGRHIWDSGRYCWNRGYCVKIGHTCTT